jgi:hypothetical protein
MARKFGIPPWIVCNWHCKWTLDEKWRPDNYAIHGLHHWIFTDEQEILIADYITAELINQGTLFTADYTSLHSCGTTDQFQPLNLLIFGAMKSTARVTR